MGVLVIRVESAEAEACSDWLFRLGATAIEDRTDAAEPTLVAGFSDDGAALAARSILSERWACRLEDTGDERAWRDRWLEFLEPIEVAGFVIHAPWHDPDQLPASHDRISIDPGRAFGSGHHPTTQLALTALRRTVRAGDRVLDAGSGTGILGIAAAKLSAATVTAIDLDHDIVAAATANVEANGVQDKVHISPTRLAQVEAHDVVVANIVIGDLKPLLENLVDLTARTLILSGFLVDQVDEIEGVLPGAPSAELSLDGWACLILDAAASAS